MFDEWHDMDEDAQKKLKMVIVFGVALVIFLTLMLLFSDVFTGGKRGDERSPRTSRPVPRSPEE